MSEHIPPRGRRGRPPREEVYRRLDTQIAELWQRMGGLPNPLEAADIWRGIWFEEAHHSTAIEGNTLVLKQVEVLLTEGRAVGAKELREYMEVRGYADAAEWVYRQAISPGAWSSGERLTLAELRQVHTTTMKPVWDVDPHPDATEREGPGSFREHEIHPFPGGMQPVSWVLVPAEVDAWIADVNALEARSSPFPEDVARLHSRFEQIHPFLDGNGRTGRLVLNLILVRLGYPPAIIYKRQRTEYLRALQRADEGEPGLLGELLARAILDNLYRFVVPAVASRPRVAPTASGAARGTGSTTTCPRGTAARDVSYHRRAPGSHRSHRHARKPLRSAGALERARRDRTRPRSGMARTWLSITVELVEGRGGSFWPRPGRVFAASRSHTFTDLATAIDDAFARWDRSHLHEFRLADETRLGEPEHDWGEPHSMLDDRTTKLAQLGLGEQFLYVFDFGDGWHHLCTVGDEKIDPLDTLGINPTRPLPFGGWGDIPDQYGRRWADDDGGSAVPADPRRTDLPPFFDWWGEGAGHYPD